MKRLLIFLFLFPISKAHANFYSTSFDISENPISEGGRWLNGGVDGVDWPNINTNAVAGVATGNSAPVQFADPTAVLKGAWGQDQMVTFHVFCSNPTTSQFEEVEARLRAMITPNRITGYEVFSRCSGTNADYFSIVRWDGPLGKFTELLHLDGAQYGVADGDTFVAIATGTWIAGFKNGVFLGGVNDTIYGSTNTGNPGMGMNYGAGQTPSHFGLKDYIATDNRGVISANTTPGVNLVGGASIK